MTNPAPYTDLDHWLDRATQGVPRRWAASIRAELTAHFEDTTADLLHQGVPQQTAHQHALAALGDPRVVAQGFNDVHRGRRHYLAAVVASALLLLENFELPQRFLMPGGAEGSTLSRFFYFADHVFSTLLIVYVVFVIGRLAMWRFGQEALNTPIKIVLGGLMANVLGVGLLDIAVETQNPFPTLLNASSFVEGLGLLLRDGSILITSAGLIALGVRTLPALNRLAKGIAVVVINEGVVALLYVLVLYLDGRISGYFYVLLVINTTILLLAISLLFIRSRRTYRRPPTLAA